MLYTFAQAQYTDDELTGYFNQVNADDAILLWQDGTLLPLKYPQLFEKLNAQCYVLELDVAARGLTTKYQNTNIKVISMHQLVKLSEQYYPQFSL